MFAAARWTDTINHDMLTPCGLIGPPLAGPAPGGMVLIEKLPAAYVTCSCVCSGVVAVGLVHPPPPGPPPPIISGSATVLINKMPAARWFPSGDMGACGVLLGYMPLLVMRRVFIGGASTVITSLQFNGTLAERQRLALMVWKIRNSGPEGEAFIEALENSPTQTSVSIGTSYTDKNGNTYSTSSMGGGMTSPPSISNNGGNEVVIDPTDLTDYQATDGSTVTETPEGLLLHELGHATANNNNHPSHAPGGSGQEQHVRDVTNPIREELGMKPEDHPI